MTDQIDAIELLLRDHRLIDGLAEQLDATDDPAEIRRLYLRIVEELSAHEAAEQQVVFPAFRASLEIADDDTLAHRMGEHEELNELLAEMRSLAPDGFGFTKRGSALLLEVKGHFQREEETVFARMRATFSADELAELGSRALAVKQHSPRSPTTTRTSPPTADGARVRRGPTITLPAGLAGAVPAHRRGSRILTICRTVRLSATPRSSVSAPLDL